MIKKYIKAIKKYGTRLGKILMFPWRLRVAVCDVLWNGRKTLRELGLWNRGVGGCPSARSRLRQLVGACGVFVWDHSGWAWFLSLTQSFLWRRSCMSKHRVRFCADCSHIYQSHCNRFVFSKQAEPTPHTHKQKIKGTFVSVGVRVCIRFLLYVQVYNQLYFIFLLNNIPETSPY